MRLLVLGGTRFVGRHVAEAALAAGWELTLFNRGESDPAAFPEAERLTGDRDGGLDALKGGEWDAVVDTSGYVPRIVRQSAEALSGRCDRYLFISSAGVYADKSQPGLAEDAPLVDLDDPYSEDVAEHYDGLKALCEDVVKDTFNERATIIRPGLIVGPHDATNRFTYWVTRIARGGDVLAPEPRDQPVQVIDARDLAAFALHLAAESTSGTFNAVGDIGTMESTLTTIIDATESSATLHWLPEAKLLSARLEPWRDVPLWLAPASDRSYAGFLAMSNARAKAVGLQLRPLESTVREILDWARTTAQPPAALDPAVEQRLLGGG